MSGEWKEQKINKMRDVKIKGKGYSIFAVNARFDNNTKKVGEGYKSRQEAMKRASRASEKLDCKIMVKRRSGRTWYVTGDTARRRVHGPSVSEFD